jgi:nitrite reductase/ring-hydroxylating ferredoxin subunit
MNEQMERIANLNELPEGELIPVTTAGGLEVLLTRIGRDVYAIEPVCTHQDAWLDAGWVHPESLEVECPLHDGRFDLRTGAVTQEPPTVPIKTYEVSVEGDDVLLGPEK